MRNPRFGLTVLFLGLLAVSLTTCAGPVQLTAILVDPVTPSIPVGATQQFTATGVFSDTTRTIMTTQVSWSSSNTSVAIVNSSGLATALAVGTATITATTSTQYTPTGQATGNTVLTVTAATLSSISVTPANASIPVGVTPQFTALGAFSDGTSVDITTQVIWSSSNTSVATVNSSGLATTIAVGTATIAATSGSISGSTALTVNSATLSSISVTPANSSLPVGVNRQFTASGTYSDGTSFDITPQVTWSSGNPSVAIVNSSGLATAVAVGTTTIAATSGSILGSTILTVNSATLSSISVTPANPSIAAGVNQQFTATGTYSDGTSFDITLQVAWWSGNPSVAAVNSSGLAISIAAGTVTITATLGSISGSASLTVTSAVLTSISVTPTNPGVFVGATVQFTATGIYSDGTSHDITTQVAWTSGSLSVAVVSTDGLALCILPGLVSITATSGSISGSTILSVSSG